MLSAINAGTNTPCAADSSAAHELGGGSSLSPAERLLVLMVFSEMTKSDGAKTSVDVDSERLAQLREEARKALAEAREAQEDSGFWDSISNVLNGDIASLAEVVAVAAAAVATGGTAVAVLAAITIGATLASRYADELGIPPSVAVGLGVAAGLASVASGNLGGATGALSSLQAGANTARLVAQSVSIGATAGGAITHGVSSYFGSKAIAARADVRAAESEQVLESSSIDESLKRLEESLDRKLSAFHSTTQMMSNDRESAQAVLRSFSGAA